MPRASITETKTGKKEIKSGKCHVPITLEGKNKQRPVDLQVNDSYRGPSGGRLLSCQKIVFKRTHIQITLN